MEFNKRRKVERRDQMLSIMDLSGYWHLSGIYSSDVASKAHLETNVESKLPWETHSIMPAVIEELWSHPVERNSFQLLVKIVMLLSFVFRSCVCIFFRIFLQESIRRLNSLQYIPNQWISIFAHSDWLLKVGIYPLVCKTQPRARVGGSFRFQLRLKTIPPSGLWREIIDFQVEVMQWQEIKGY